MISVQYPHLTAHPFGIMSDPAAHAAMPSMPRFSPQDTFSSGREPKANKATAVTTKKRPSRAGTRSVSTLSSSQLERKRANDREAQRAIRQRTKDHIEGLEKQIQELTASSDTNAKLMQAMQRNQELEQENALLRSRLNHAIATMNENGLSSEHIMLSTGPSSPSRRIKLATQIRTSSTPAPRSIPTPTVSAVSHHDHWGSAYSPASSSVERSPSVADISPIVGSNVRWNQQPPQVSPPIPDHDRPMLGVETNIHQPMGYSYAMDASGRPVQPVQPVAYQPEPQMMQSYAQQQSPQPHVNEYHAHHNGQPIQPAQTPTYAHYPPGPQSYIPPSPHEADPHMQMMQHRQSMDSQQQLMYNMPQNLKAER